MIFTPERNFENSLPERWLLKVDDLTELIAQIISEGSSTKTEGELENLLKEAFQPKEN